MDAIVKENKARANTIAKNTLFLYLRSFMTMGLGIYSSRILLKTLGVEDYGVYNLVGGVVAMFSSLKGLFASSIQRFLNFEKGKENPDKVQQVFNLSLLTQVLLSVIFIIIVECFGLWFIENKLNVPAESLNATYFVFHLSVFSAVIYILGAPFDGAIVANEKFNVFAWLSVTDAVLKLGIIYLLPLLTFAYLKSYAVLMVGVSVFNFIFNFVYCRRFAECKIAFFWDKSLFKQLFGFAGWNFLGNTAFALVQEGLNMLLNMFGGVAYNAARGIANQVKMSVSILGNNLGMAVRPFVVQKTATEEKEVIFGYIYRLSYLMFLILLLTVSPVIIFCESILKVWLVEPPIMANIFMPLMMLHLLQRALHEPMDLLFKSFGDIKHYQILDSLTLFLSLPVGYVALKLGMPLYSVFVVVCAVEVINLVSLLCCAKRKLEFGIWLYVKKVGLPCIKALVILGVIAFLFYFTKPENIFSLALFAMLFEIVAAASVYVLLLGKQDRDFVKGFVLRKVGA